MHERFRGFYLEKRESRSNFFVYYTWFSKQVYRNEILLNKKNTLLAFYLYEGFRVEAFIPKNKTKLLF